MRQLKLSEILNVPFNSAAHYTFFNRIKLFPLMNSLSGMFKHPLLEENKSEELEDKWKKLTLEGRNVLQERAEIHLKQKFPNFPCLSPLIDIYTNSKTLSSFAKHIGLDTAMLDLHGLPTIKRISLAHTLFKETSSVSYRKGVGLVLNNTKYQLSKAPPLFQEKVTLDGSFVEEGIYSDCILALIALLHEENMNLLTTFLRDHFFEGGIIKNLSDICRPSTPMLSLYRYLGYQPTYRLLHETGRYSSTSIYVVGVYNTIRSSLVLGEKLGEGHGPSILVAQERAATEALRAEFLRRDLSHNTCD